MGQMTLDQLPAVPATAKQRNYIAVLMDDMGWHSEQMAIYAHEQDIDLVNMSMAQASAFIDGLKRLAHPVTQHDDDQGLGLFDEPPPVRTPTRARVICLVCGHEARIPILADAKICDTCLADLPGQRQRIEAELDAAEQRSINAELNLHAALDGASERDRGRYQNALDLKAANDARIAAAWAKALTANDGLAALLAAHDAQLAAEQALTQAVVRGEVTLAEIAKVQQ